MPYEVEESGSLTRTASVTIPKDEYDKDVDKALRKLAGRVKVRGFRKGKVPLSVLRKQYGESVQQDVIQNLVNRYVDEIVSGADNVLFVDQPKVTTFQENGVGLAFEVAFEVRPDVDPIGYLGLVVEKPKIEVAKEDIDAELEGMRRQFSSLEPIELRTAIAKDDVVTFDFEALGREDDEDLADFEGTDAQITIGEANALPGMEDALIGQAFDATVVATVEPGPSYQVEKLRDKKFDVQLKVKSVKQRILPDLDDEFAADTGEAQTLLELRQKLKEQIAHQQEHSAGHYAENDMMERLLDQNDFDLPPLFVRQQIDNKINQQLQQLGQQGIDLKNLNLDVDKIREDLREETEDQLRAEFLLLAIAEKEQLQVTDEDMESFFQHQSMHMNAPADQIKRFYQQNPNHWQQAAGSALLEKTVNFLLDQADIKDIEWPSEEEQQAKADEKKAKSEKKAKKADKPKKEAKAPKKEAKADKGDDIETTLSGLKVDELKDLLRDNDLAVSGKKADLIARLVEAGVKP